MLKTFNRANMEETKIELPLLYSFACQSGGGSVCVENVGIQSEQVLSQSQQNQQANIQL